MITLLPRSPNGKLDDAANRSNRMRPLLSGTSTDSPCVTSLGLTCINHAGSGRVNRLQSDVDSPGSSETVRSNNGTLRDPLRTAYRTIKGRPTRPWPGSTRRADMRYRDAPLTKPLMAINQAPATCVLWIECTCTCPCPVSVCVPSSPGALADHPMAVCTRSWPNMAGATGRDRLPSP